METIKKSCQTCLYMATHEKCSDCLHSKEDWKEYHAHGRGKMPPFRYLHYQEGNWLKRVYHFELEGEKISPYVKLLTKDIVAKKKIPKRAIKSQKGQKALFNGFLQRIF